MGSEIVGSEIAGSEIAGCEIVRSEIVGSEIAGRKIAESDIRGSNIMGIETTEKKTVKKKATKRIDINRIFRQGITVPVLSVLLSIMAAMPVYASQWMQDGNGWRWKNDNGSYPENCWQWLDGNQDGMAEHYYFGPDGYMISDTTAPDGQQVNEEGAWIMDGVIQREEMAGADNRTWQINMSETEYIQFTDMANRINGKNRTWNGEEPEHQRTNPTSTEDISSDESAYRIIELVNVERQKRGENVLSVNQELMENAAARAVEACIYYSHTRPDKSKFDTAITVERYSSAENLAKLYSRDSMEMIAEAAVEKWMDSESHKKQLLDDRWTETGAGVCESGGYIYISQIFVKGM